MKIDGLHNQTELRSLYLAKNLIRSIENLDHMKYLDTLDVSYNMISKIENLDLLPNFTKLIISHNKLTEINDLIHLIKCEQLSVLDIQYNFIKDPNVVEEVFAKLPNLKNLTYLDDRPVFPMDRACAEAFYSGGIEKEREIRQQWIDAEQKKILDSVKWLSNKRQVIEATHHKTELNKQAEGADLSTDDIHVTPGDVDWLYGNVDSAKNESDSDQELEETNNDVETYTVSSSNARDEELDTMTDCEPLNTQISEEFYSSEMVNLKADNTELNSSLKKNDEELFFDNNTVISEQKNNSNEDEIESISVNEEISLVKVNENINNSIFSHLNNDNNVSDHNGMNRSNLLSFLNITDQLDETIVLSDETPKENPSHIPKSAFIEELCNEAYNPNNTFCMNTALDKQENFMNFDKTNDQNVIEIYEEQDNTNEL
ncbi:unnamed protein product [Schistosoma mattheei]|uniref:Uncharacterized protein n=1 Tax=Schistosoma mattheei TaxID=31246 RepID=A0A3P8CUP8_9TREM|nr:unnamed protein product [Schistosoma mattheei]